MSPDWSCTVLVHNRTCCGKYRILYVLIDLYNSRISDLCITGNNSHSLMKIYSITLDYTRLNYSTLLNTDMGYFKIY